MIRNQWYALLSSKQVKQNKPIGVTRLGEKLVFWRDQSGKVVCLRDYCIHRGVALSLGKVIGDNLQCPFHGFEYDPSGRIILIPANGINTPIPKAFQALGYPAYEAHGLIFIYWGVPDGELAPPRFFDDIDDSFSFGEVIDPWNTHYSRAIENQLDVAHLPFVHSNSIGRGNRTLVNGPLVEWVDEKLFYIYTFNTIDEGQLPLRANQLSHPEVPFKLEFLFPNLWQNHISLSTRVLVAFVPVDEEHTLLYLRFYQNSIRLPVLKDIVNYLAMPFNRYIAHQDRGIVQTQLPKQSGLRIGEQLIQADQPIIEYRRRRNEYIESSRQAVKRNPRTPSLAIPAA